MTGETSGLVMVEPPYDGVFIAVRRALAPSAVFTYDRYWVMTPGQVAKIRAQMEVYVAQVETRLEKAISGEGAGGRTARDLKSDREMADSMRRVIQWLDKAEPWIIPHDDDEGFDRRGDDEG